MLLSWDIGLFLNPYNFWTIKLCEALNIHQTIHLVQHCNGMIQACLTKSHSFNQQAA